ncbi:unnamed protein product [Scytosiphon promiscuus]
MPVNIDINVSSLTSSHVKGDVVLNVNTRDAEEYSAYLLKLRLVGRIKTKATHDERAGTASGPSKTSGSKAETATEKREILGQEKELESFDGRVAPGKHSFAFSLSLPPDLPPSTEEIGKNGGMCSIRYSLKARLYRNPPTSEGVSSDASDPRSTQHIKLWSTRPSEAHTDTPFMVGPETQAVRTCCSKAGSVSVGFHVDSMVVRTGQAVGLDIAARNDSSRVVTAMDIKIQQVASWTAHGDKDHKKRTLSSILVRDSSLGALQWPAEASARRGQSLASVAESARDDLERQIAAGTGTRYELFVPRDALLSVQTDTVEVRHFLVVKLQIKGANSPPDISTALQVQMSTVPTAGTQPETGLLLPSLPEAMP